MARVVITFEDLDEKGSTRIVSDPPFKTMLDEYFKNGHITPAVSAAMHALKFLHERLKKDEDSGNKSGLILPGELQ